VGPAGFVPASAAGIFCFSGDEKYHSKKKQRRKTSRKKRQREKRAVSCVHGAEAGGWFEVREGNKKTVLSRV